METEMFASGFCKAQNQTRMVEMIFETDENGQSVLTETDCAYGKCPHSKDCILVNSQK